MPKIHRGICPDAACERVAIEVQRQKSEREALRIITALLGVSPNTVKSWAFRNKVGATAITKNKSTPANATEICAISDLYTLMHDSGSKKIIFQLLEVDGNWSLVLQEYRMERKGKAVATKNRLILPLNPILQVPKKLGRG